MSTNGRARLPAAFESAGEAFAGGIGKVSGSAALSLLFDDRG
jgi:hypothetical protein